MNHSKVHLPNTEIKCEDPENKVPGKEVNMLLPPMYFPVGLENYVLPLKHSVNGWEGIFIKLQ